MNILFHNLESESESNYLKSESNYLKSESNYLKSESNYLIQKYIYKKEIKTKYNNI